MTRTLALVIATLLGLTACGSDSPGAATETALQFTTADTIAVSGWATGFDRPTQMVFAEDGDLVIAELAGGENDATGRVVRVEAGDRESRTVLQQGLDKPTGIAITGERLWIMERNRLSFASLEPGAERTVVADGLPSNGRSQGTLTVTPDGALLFDTSGAKRGSERVDGSGMLFAIENAADRPSEPVPVAVGFKHAYAHVVDDDGQLWSVEMTDGTFDGERASDELVAVDPGADAGWPQCVDDNRVVQEFGGTAELCATTTPSHALFGPGATPTSIVIAPWDADTFVVALWLRSQVVTVPRTAPDDAPHEPAVIIEGIESPQHLLVDGDGILLSDHDSGEIVRLSER